MPTKIGRAEIETIIKELEDQGGEAVAWGKLMRVLVDVVSMLTVLQGQVAQLQNQVRELKNGDRGQSW